MMEKPRMIIVDAESDMAQQILKMVEDQKVNRKPEGLKAERAPKAGNPNPVTVSTSFEVEGNQKAESAVGYCFAGCLLSNESEEGADCLEIVMGSFDLRSVVAILDTLEKIKFRLLRDIGLGMR